MADAKNKVTVTVIGAGMAGLSAAHQLTERGYKVTILEANDRIGGRIQTITTKSGDVVEAGANWLHHPDFIGQMKNQPFLAPDQNKFEKAALYDLNPSEHFEMEEVMARASHSVMLANALEVGSSDADKIKGNDLGESSDSFVTSGIGKILQSEFDTEHLDIHLHSKVTKVVQTDSGVEVSYSDSGQNTQVIKSDYIINTMPAKVLEANAHIFTPALEPNLTDALEAIHMTTVRKVSLTFDSQAFASAANENPDLVHKSYLLFADKSTDTLIPIVNLNAMNIDSGKDGSTTLLAFIDYNHPQFANMSSDEAVSKLTDMITSQFPGLNKSSVTEVHDVDWAKNELSLGAWPYLDERAGVDKIAAINQDHGRMVLAGDWTVLNSHDQSHYFLGDDMYAAAVSGLNAAEKIFEFDSGIVNENFLQIAGETVAEHTILKH